MNDSIVMKQGRFVQIISHTVAFYLSNEIEYAQEAIDTIIDSAILHNLKCTPARITEPNARPRKHRYGITVSGDVTDIGLFMDNVKRLVGSTNVA